LHNPFAKFRVTQLKGNKMTLVIAAFFMVVILGIVTILRLETESEKGQFARKAGRSNARFIDQETL
jgi:hypothetical protein